MKEPSVVVVGAGIVGVCCALELQRLGFGVRLVDERPPGTQASFGNAGVLARSSLVPFNNPGLWRSLPRLLSNRTAQFRHRPGFVARNAGWGIGFLASARAAEFERTKAALDSLIVLSAPEHRRLMDEAGISHRLRDNGWIFLYRTRAAFDAAGLGRAAFRQFGVATQELDADGIAELEPSLRRIFERGLWIQDASSVDNPGAVVQAYAAAFAQRGGELLRRRVVRLARRESGWSVVDDAGGRLDADRVVVALGAWSAELLRSVGVRIPMAFERGYHMHYRAMPGAALGRPVHDVGGGCVLSPMERGLRLTTGVELNDRDAAPDLAQLEAAEVAARQAFPIGERIDDAAWRGSRPTLPDSRPAIGEVVRHRGLWLAFGHQHIGFSTGPGTAKLLGALMSGVPPPIDAAPFRPDRFV